MKKRNVDGAVRLGPRTVAWAVALLVAGCGGGGGGADGGVPTGGLSEPVADAPIQSGDPAVQPAPAPAPAPAPGASSPAPAPAPGPAPQPEPLPPPAPTPLPAPAPVDLQMSANGSYAVPATATGTYALRLPPSDALRVGDTVRVSGSGGARWRVTQNEGQAVDTTGLPGNTVPGTRWVPRTVDAALPAQAWSAIATSADGNTLVAGARGGGIYVSQDGGASWARGNAPVAAWADIAISPDGRYQAAVDRLGQLYTSADRGATWTGRTGTRFWGGVFISADGQRIVATETGGSIHLSNDGGASFTPVPGTANTDWREVAGSQTGDRLVAVASIYGGDPSRQGVYVSEDGGQSWTRRSISGDPPPTNNWSFAAASYDGRRMVAIDNGGYQWISTDYGATWTMRFAYSNWSGVAVSGDGRIFTALEPRNDTRGWTGYTFVSTDGGWSWNWYGENRWYRGVSLSLDGNWIAVGDIGADGQGGLLYTSQGNRTAIGTIGHLEGEPGASIELTYQGAGRFTVSQQAGGPFAIR